jgi:PPP family 3-phenylpropionic acid transporter
VIIFLIMHRLLPAFGARKLLIVTLLLTTLRWLFIGFFVSDLSMLFVAQLIHAFSFGVFHSVGIALVHEYFTGSHQGRGQALYSSTSYGAGVAVGSLVSGLVWDQWGAGVLFVFAACCTLVALAIVWKFVQPPLRAV